MTGLLHRHRRLLGYVLWAVGILVFLPRAMANDATRPFSSALIEFLVMIALLVGGYVLVDSANARAHG